MISSISRYITDFFVSKNIINENQRDIYQYGTEIMISSIISLSITVIVALLTGFIIETAAFFITFTYTRKYNGGYHASNYLKCNMIYTLNLLIVLIFAQTPSAIFNISHIALLCMVYCMIVWRLAPIENENKPLDDDDKKKYSIISRIISVIFTAATIIIFYFNCSLSMVISMTLFSVSLSMIIEYIRKGGRINEKNHSENV